jgi:hypothetical protein
LLLKFLPACIMVSSICQVIIVGIHCHYHSDSIDSTCVRILAIISRFLLIYPSGSDVILDMSWFLVNQSLIDWPSNSIQHTRLLSEPPPLIPRFWNRKPFVFKLRLIQMFPQTDAFASPHSSG